MVSARNRLSRVRGPVGLLGLLCGLLVLLGPAALYAQAQNAPPQEPGVTMRVFQLGGAPSEICEIEPGQTPNVDMLKPTIQWTDDAAFGGPTDNFVVHAIANLTVPTAGQYTFRLRSDDGSELFIDETLVVDNDGLHGAQDKDGAVQLTAGMHALRINFFEAGGGQELTLSWRKPGDSTFSVVPTSALSTDAGIVRVTAPGTKQCVGDIDTPGDGLPLDGVNPAYDLVDLRPAGWQPKVTGLEWMGDDLLVLTWGDDDGDPSSVTSAGEVWRLSGVKDADDPTDVTHVRIAEGLREPQGIKVVDGDIYISEKHQLSRLVDADSNGSYEAKEQVATWPFDGNFHEFAFGMLYEDGFFYLNLSVSINLGGATTDPQGSHDRGTTLKINKDTGEVEHIAGGLRTPHGIGWGPEGEIFVTDNQGSWLPANKLIHIQPGEFYNHYTTEPDGTPGRFDDQRPTPPALWLPHNEIANSPSQPMLIPDGPFAGQMWVADVTYGGIQRAFLEKVEGQYQGAYFRMTQGLESGITHMALEDDGSIIVGGLGAGGNWGQAGKLQFGLQKLVPNGTETFDIEKMELAEGGFDLTYTKPLSDETLADLATKYQVQQWGYVPTPAYGGPKVNEEDLTVTEASVSADRMTVSLKIDGLKPDRVVYVRSPRPFEAEGGEPLLSTEAWYTLNQLPGYVAPVSEGLYELEDAQLMGGAKFDTEHAGYSGMGFVSGFQTVGASATIDVQAPEAGDYRMALRYANGPNPFDGPKTITLVVNGESRQITLPATGAWPNYRLYLDDVTLEAGANTIELRYAAGDDGNVNLDSVRLAPAGVQRYEAEAATLAGGANAQTEHPGYSGEGYVGGYLEAGASTTFEVTALADGAADVTLRYANGPNPFAGTKEVSLYVNGNFVKKLGLPDTGGWAAYGTVTDRLVLRAGSNDVSIRYDAGDDGNVNIDYLEVTQNEPVQCAPTFDPNDTFDGDVLDRCRWTTIVNEDPSGYSLADGELQIEAQTGDITGGTFTAPNVLLQRAPADGSWSATTKLSLDGTDDYIQAGIVAHASAGQWAKLVLMRRPNGEWVTELGRPSGYQNGPTLPAGAQDGITLQMYSRDGQVRGRYSLDDGETWTEIGSGFPSTGLANAGIGLAAYNGTGAEVATFEFFDVGEPPELPPVPACEEPYTPEAGYTMLFDGTDESLEDWKYAGGGQFVREDCTIKSVGGFGLLYTEEEFEAPYSLKLQWMMPGDDNSGIFVGFSDTGANTDQTAIQQGEEIQIDATDNPAQTTGAIYLEQAPDIAAREAVLNPPGEWNDYEIIVREDRIVVYLNGTKINEWIDDDPNVDLTTGHIGLQTHGAGDDNYFRNIRIRDLDEEEPVEGAPTVQGFADPASGAAPLRVRFSATGLDPEGGALQYRWEFGDGDGAALSPSAVHTYRAPGTYEATVTATDEDGMTATDTVEVVVSEPSNGSPTVEAAADVTSGPAPLRVRLSAGATDDGPMGQLTYEWSFGDGESAFGRRAVHRYLEPGTYEATVTVTDAGGNEASDTVQITVAAPPANVAPTVQASADPMTGAAPLRVRLTAQGTDSDGDRMEYSWDFGDGSPAAAARNGVHTYTQPGTYTATVTVTDEDGATGSAEVEIVVAGGAANTAPTVQAAADPAGPGTAPMLVRFTSAARDADGDMVSTVWDFGDGVRAGGPVAVHTYTTPGVHTATVTVTDPSGATGTATVQVTVAAAQAPPVAVVQQQDAGDVAGETARASAKVSRVRSLRALRQRGVRVAVTCAAAGEGRAVLTLTRKAARKLGLRKRTLAARTVDCAAGKTAKVRLKPSKAARRKLGSGRAVKLVVRVSVDDADVLARKLSLR